MKKIGKWLTWSGLAVGVVSVIAGIVLAVAGFTKVANGVNDSFDIYGPTQYEAEADETLWLYGSGTTGIVIPSCMATGPATVQQTTASSDTSFTINNAAVTVFGKLHFPEAGTYTINCDTVGVMAGPEVSTWTLFAGGAGIMLAVLGGILGAMILVVGVILWVLGASRAQNAPPIGWQPGAQQYPVSGYPGQQYPGQQYPNQPGYQPGAPDDYRPPTPDQQPPTNA